MTALGTPATAQAPFTVFVISQTCIVDSVVVNPVPPVFYDIGLNMPVEAPLPSITVTPAACAPLVQLDWTNASGQPFVTVDNVNGMMLIQTQDTSLVGPHPIALEA